MCSRFEFDPNPKSLLNYFGFENLPVEFTIGEIRPTNQVLVITNDQSLSMGWGLRVNWGNKLLINARYETLEKRSTFRPLLSNRCLIPATAYFEWRHEGHKRLKNRIEPLGTQIMTFAGLHSEGSFVIITCPPAGIISHIHQRMPLMIDPSERANWINGSLKLNHVVKFLTSSSYRGVDYSEECFLNDQSDLFDH